MTGLKNYIPALRYGHKISPDEIAGIVGLPYVGNVFYIDPTAGNDVSGGQSFNKAYATVKGALESELGTAGASTGNHDVFLIAPSGGTGRTAETGAIAWNYRFTHLVGSTAPLRQDLRAGLGFGASASIAFSQNGCLIKGVTFDGSADVNVPVTISGDYNSFIGVDFKGSLNDTTGDDAAARAVYVNGADELYFAGCTIGSDTYTRSAANASLELDGGAARNVFEECLFLCFADAATPLFVKIASAANIDRLLWFKNCTFHNAIHSSGTGLTKALSVHAAVGGTVLLDGCSVTGVTDWSDDYTAVRGANMPDITAANAGFTETVAT